MPMLQHALRQQSPCRRLLPPHPGTGPHPLGPAAAAAARMVAISRAAPRRSLSIGSRPSSALDMHASNGGSEVGDSADAAAAAAAAAGPGDDIPTVMAPPTPPHSALPCFASSTTELQLQQSALDGALRAAAAGLQAGSPAEVTRVNIAQAMALLQQPAPPATSGHHRRSIHLVEGGTGPARGRGAMLSQPGDSSEELPRVRLVPSFPASFPAAEGSPLLPAVHNPATPELPARRSVLYRSRTRCTVHSAKVGMIAPAVRVAA
jgi:hypothetical protein